jgi:hypothetical protein
MPYDYSAQSQHIEAQMLRLGLTSDRLMLIGAFVVAYGLFETTLERALWTLSEASVAGVRPFTEKMNSAEQFALLSAGNPKLSPKCNRVLKIAAQAAEDLNEYRNSLVHGHLLSFGDGGTPSFMKNPSWHKEKRNKAVGDAYIDEPYQDLVLIAAWTLARLVRLVEKCLSDPETQTTIEELEADVRRAKSYAGEARNLRSLMNHEKN